MILTVDLSLGWEFYYTREQRWYPARVPGCVHTDLQRAGLIPDPFYGDNEKQLQWIERLDWTYRTSFDLEADFLAHREVELVAEGLDTLATLTLNGTEIASTANMFCGHRFPVSRWLRPGRNTLEIVFANTLDYLAAHESWQPFRERNDPVGGRSRIRKEQCQYSWDWGPRFVTCGIWQPIRLEAWAGNRFRHVQVKQEHGAEGSVRLQFTPELARPDPTVNYTGTVLLDREPVASIENFQACVARPALWWPAGQGAQPLYEICFELRHVDGTLLDTWRQRIGLRVIELVRDKDSAGESFFFRVNGRAIFAKGANWIPDHAFVTECKRADYEDRLEAAVAAHMNMIRVWGGGIYESDLFYDLCDELGLLVWQDFMFACALYPGAPDYCELVRAEADSQIRRLRHHSCLALWCGNNEIPMMDILQDEMRRDPAQVERYEQIFHRVLPAAVAEHDPATPYWPSSPWTPPEFSSDANAPGAGDIHYWEVWHSRAPVKNYEKLEVRFCSEFGMQSYASSGLAETFCPPQSLNVFSPIMENHQKNGGGNATMLHYMAQRYRYATGYSHLAYLSQLNQAYCMKVGIEHFRHRAPFTMGALYWQLNDCWPVASWSSLEFGGAWKALHHEARRFFAPSLVYLRTAGDVQIGRYNQVFNTIDSYEIFTIHDGPVTCAARLVWSLRTLRGQRLGQEHSRECMLEAGKVVGHAVCALVDAGIDVAKEGVYLRAELQDAAGGVLSRQTALFTVPRFIEFEDPKITVGLGMSETGEALELTLTSGSLAPAVAVGFGTHNVRLSDNWFDLHAGESRLIVARGPLGVGLDELRAALTITSLWHSYQPEKTTGNATIIPSETPNTYAGIG